GKRGGRKVEGEIDSQFSLNTATHWLLIDKTRVGYIKTVRTYEIEDIVISVRRTNHSDFISKVHIQRDARGVEM
ncbi:hypothetical protein GBAR_LOCUS6299, partial [Geodia barretti]